MEKPLLQFVRRLRSAGVQVSQAELIDAAHATAGLTLGERSTFQHALRTTLIKRARDIPVFDTLFDLHFSDGPVVGAAAEEPDEQSQNSLRAAIAEVRDHGQDELSDVTELLLTGQLGPLLRLVVSRSQGLGIEQMAAAPLRGTFFLNKLRRELDLDRVRAEAETLFTEMQDQGAAAEDIEALRDRVRGNLERLDKELATIVQNEVATSRFLALRRIDDHHIAERNLFQLSDDEVMTMRPVVERLARKLKDRLSMRLKRADAGRLDLKATLRQNVGLGGPLPVLRFRHKNPAKPQIVTLCDVSRSVRNFSRFMLLFLYTLKEVLPSVRSFIFVGDLTEVTQLFQQYDLNEAVSMAAAGYGLRYPFGTDYGSSLTQFVEQHLSVVNSRTTVIVLGDARNNNLPPRVESLEAIAERARKLVWLNPESRVTWKLGDSIMSLYQPTCTTVAECANVNQLAKVIEENLVPRSSGRPRIGSWST